MLATRRPEDVSVHLANGTPVTDTTETTTIPKRRSRWRWLVAMLLTLMALAVIALVALGTGPTLWTLRASLSGSPDAAAWAHVPSGQPVLLACDVPKLLESPIARALRPALNALAARHGFDPAIAETNVRQLVVCADGPDNGFAVASGFRLSPLLLARFAQPWRIVPFGAESAASDGATMLIPLEPGIVAWVPAGVDPAHVAAGLEAARSSAAEPLVLGDSALRAHVMLDDRLRARVLRELPHEAGKLVASLATVDASIAAGDELSLHLELTHRDPASATATTALLQQANTAAVLIRGAGSFAALLGPDAALLALLPPLTLAQDGVIVRVDAMADAELVTKWLNEAERRLTR